MSHERENRIRRYFLNPVFLPLIPNTNTLSAIGPAESNSPARWPAGNEYTLPKKETVEFASAAFFLRHVYMPHASVRSDTDEDPAGEKVSVCDRFLARPACEKVTGKRSKRENLK
jgi:hypothetical protein